jgi:hypothetical protein
MEKRQLDYNRSVGTSKDERCCRNSEVYAALIGICMMLHALFECFEVDMNSSFIKE